MTPADSSLMLGQAGFNAQAKWLKVLPLAMSLPGGYAYSNYLLYRSYKALKGMVLFGENLLHAPWFESMSQPERAEHVAPILEHAELIRGSVLELDGWVRRRAVIRILANWYTDWADRYTDLVETLALSADPEMVILSKQQRDVL